MASLPFSSFLAIFLLFLSTERAGQLWKKKPMFSQAPSLPHSASQLAGLPAAVFFQSRAGVSWMPVAWSYKRPSCATHCRVSVDHILRGHLTHWFINPVLIYSRALLCNRATAGSVPHTGCFHVICPTPPLASQTPSFECFPSLSPFVQPVAAELLAQYSWQKKSEWLTRSRDGESQRARAAGGGCVVADGRWDYEWGRGRGPASVGFRPGF